MKGLGTLKGRTYGADDGYFQAVQYPGDPQPDYDKEVKAAPWQPVQPKGYVSAYDRR